MSSSTIPFEKPEMLHAFAEICKTLHNGAHGAGCLCVLALNGHPHRIERGTIRLFRYLVCLCMCTALFQQQHSISLSDGSAVCVAYAKPTKWQWCGQCKASSPILWPHSQTIRSALFPKTIVDMLAHMYSIFLSTVICGVQKWQW